MEADLLGLAEGTRVTSEAGNLTSVEGMHGDATSEQEALLAMDQVCVPPVPHYHLRQHHASP